jgi:predicted dithiol-disulfide oxidoreductase (DUF899 family)
MPGVKLYSPPTTKSEKSDDKHSTDPQGLARGVELLEAEKEHKARDELARRRQAAGFASKRTIDSRPTGAPRWRTFPGRLQLLVYHFMFGPDYTAGCPSCSAIADGFNGSVVHLENHDEVLGGVERPPRQAAGVQAADGLVVSWPSSGGDFNFDFNVSFTEEQKRKGDYEYNYGPASRCRAETEDSSRSPRRGRNGRSHFLRQLPGMSAFARGRRRLPHLFRVCARTGRPVGMYQWLDRAPKDATRAGCGGAITTGTTMADLQTSHATVAVQHGSAHRTVCTSLLRRRSQSWRC